MRKRYAKELLTDPALRARVLASIRGAAAPAAAFAGTAGHAPEPTIIHLVEMRRPPFWERPWFAVLFVTLGAVAGGYLLQLS